MRNDIGADRNYLGKLDETRAEGCNTRRKSSRAFVLCLIGQKTWRARKDPSPPVSQECDDKGRQAVPDHNDSKDHAYKKLYLSKVQDRKESGNWNRHADAQTQEGSFSSLRTSSIIAKSAPDAGKRPYFDLSNIASALARVDRRFGSGSAKIHSRHVWAGRRLGERRSASRAAL